MSQRQVGAASSRADDVVTRGEVPNLVSLPRARAYASSNTSIPANSNTQIMLTNFTFNSDSASYSLASGGLTVNLAGLYMILAGIQLTSGTAGNRNFNVRVAGSVVGEATAYANTDEARLSGVTIASIGAGQSVTFHSYCTSAVSAVNGGGNTWVALLKVA